MTVRAEIKLQKLTKLNWGLKLTPMKVESLVIVNEDVTVNDISNFAHTAHHARRVVFSGNLTEIVLFLLKGVN